MFDFERLLVYQKAESTYKELLLMIPRLSIDKITKDQLSRASLSFVLNIAEGAGKYSKNDKRRYYVIAKGSLKESVALIRVLRLQGIIDRPDYERCYERLLEVAKLLTRLIQSMGQGGRRGERE